jgi:hypothetical protein
MRSGLSTWVGGRSMMDVRGCAGLGGAADRKSR